MASDGDDDYRVREYWNWLGGALFLLVTVDMITTVYAVRVVGLAAEVNPLTRWSIAAGPLTFASVNLAAVVCTALLFDRVLHRLRRTPSPYDTYFAYAIEVWLGLLLAVGLAVFANNLSVIFFGYGLL